MTEDNLLAHLKKQAKTAMHVDGILRNMRNLGYGEPKDKWIKLSDVEEAVLGVNAKIRERIFVMENKMKPKWNEIQQLKWVLALLGAKQK